VSKTVLVTGGAGFIGSNFVHYLKNKYPDYRILILDALTYAGEYGNLPSGVNDPDESQIQFWYGNVCNQGLVVSLAREADIVVHFAAETHVTRSIFDNLVFFETDVIGTHAVINAAIDSGKIERFIHISTSEVYGTAISETMTEEHPLNPSSPYASAKCGADRLVYSYWETYKTPAVIVRPFNNYGPRQHLEKVIPRFIASALMDEQMTVHGGGTSSRDFIHVEDTCLALDLVMHAPVDKVAGEVFNVASGQHRSVLSLAEDIARKMEADPEKIVFVGERPGQVERHTGDSTKISEVLGWKQTINWEDGLDKTIEWFKKNRTHWEKQLWMRHIPIRTASGKIELH
tara:strand:- start:1762 stop:2796 length:1035 start_codon:yes stop_codon:yes gene_type:complete